MARILIVDDAPDILVLVEASLRHSGHEAVTCANPKIALDLLDAGGFDGMILDLMMPEVSGFDILDQIRGRRTHADLPILVLSARQHAEARLESFRLGATDFLSKPFVPEELVVRIGRLVEARAARSAAVEGDVATYAVTDFVQSLSMNAKTGTVSFRGEAEESRIWLDKGRVVGARHGALSGEQATYAVFSLLSGRFRFEEDILGSQRDEIPTLSYLLMNYHWFLDEVRRLERSVPSESAQLTVLGSADSEESDLPLRSVLDAIADGHTTRRRLERETGLAPIVVTASVATLVESGVLQAGADIAPTGEISTLATPDFESAVHKLRIASGRPADLHLLAASGSSQWDRLQTHIGAAQVRWEGGWERSERRRRLRRAATVQTTVADCRIHLHVVDAEVLSTVDIALLLPVVSGSAFWIGSEDLDALRDVVTRSAHSSRAAGLLVATDPSVAEGLESLAADVGWRFASRAPADFSTTLGLIS